MGFSVSHFLGRFFGFCTKKVGFLVFVSLTVSDFPFFSIWFSVFGQKTSRFSDLVSNAVFGFACSVSGFRFPQSRALAAGVLK